MATVFLDNDKLKYALSQGEHNALALIMDHYYKPLCSYVYSLSNDNELSQDVVQNTFVALWEQRKNAQSIKSLKNYLYKAAYNTFTNEWRKNKKMLFVEEKHFSALIDICANEDLEFLQKQMMLVNREIQQLPPKCKEAFLLSKKEGLTNMEIAHFMDISVRTVETQISIAYKILRKKLKSKIEAILFFIFRPIL